VLRFLMAQAGEKLRLARGDILQAVQEGNRHEIDVAGAELELIYFVQGSHDRQLRAAADDIADLGAIRMPVRRLRGGGPQEERSQGELVEDGKLFRPRNPCYRAPRPEHRLDHAEADAVGIGFPDTRALWRHG